MMYCFDFSTWKNEYDRNLEVRKMLSPACAHLLEVGQTRHIYEGLLRLSDNMLTMILDDMSPEDQAEAVTYKLTHTL